MDPVSIVPHDLDATARPARHAALVGSVAALIEGERDWLANLANIVAAVYESVPGTSWAGFYLFKGGELVLGPFQGRPACIRIRVGEGVCGTAFAQRTTQVVPDVAAFPGHIACDSRSRSEIVVPVIDASGRSVAVLDLDSTELGAFDHEDALGLEAVVAAFAGAIDWDRACQS